VQAVIGCQAEDPHVVEVTLGASVAVDQAVGRIGEVDRAIGAEHAVVGRVQPLSHVVVDQNRLFLGLEVETEERACARSGGDDTAASEDQAVGTWLANGGVPGHTAGVIARRLQPDRAPVFRRPFDDVVDLGVGDQQVAVGAANPHRPFGVQEASRRPFPPWRRRR